MKKRFLQLADTLHELPEVIDFGALLAKPAQREEAPLPPSQAIRQRVTRRRFYDLSQIENAVRFIDRLPEQDETIHAVMGGDFDGWSLIPAIRRLSGEPITELIVCTLGFNAANNQHLCRMIDSGDVERVTVLCSVYFKAADADTFNAARERLEQRGQRLFSARNHAKVILAETAGAHYCVESSANLRSCRNVEQFTLTQSKAVFDFHKTWIERLTTETP